LARILAGAEVGQSYICESACDRRLEERLLREFHERSLSAKVAEENNGVVRIDAMTPQGRLFFLRLEPVAADGRPVKDGHTPQTHTRATVVWLKALDRDDGLAELNKIYMWQAEPPHPSPSAQGERGPGLGVTKK
jgi:hypothetical protein